MERCETHPKALDPMFPRGIPTVVSQRYLAVLRMDALLQPVVSPHIPSVFQQEKTYEQLL